MNIDSNHRHTNTSVPAAPDRRGLETQALRFEEKRDKLKERLAARAG